MINIILGILIIFFAIPAGYLLAYLTKDELEKGRKWFILIISIFFIISLISLFFSKIISIFSIFVCLVTLISLYKSYEKIRKK